jgi:hypothetical protein
MNVNAQLSGVRSLSLGVGVGVAMGQALVPAIRPGERFIVRYNVK